MNACFFTLSCRIRLDSSERRVSRSDHGSAQSYYQREHDCQSWLPGGQVEGPCSAPGQLQAVLDDLVQAEDQHTDLVLVSEYGGTLRVHRAGVWKFEYSPFLAQ